MTRLLEKAFQSLSALPAAEQDKLGEALLSYAEKWNALKQMIDEGTAELGRGEDIEVSDVDTLVDEIATKHGRP